MPIYAYRCAACGFENDHLQKLSDPVLLVCPQCGEATYSKQVTAAGFQLKGSGWYATDFRDSGKKPSSTTEPASPDKPASTDKAASTEKTASTDKAAVPASTTGAGACADN